MNRLPSLSQLHSRRLVALSLLSPLLACTSKNRFSLATLAGHSNIDKPAVNQFLIQYFINYNLKHGWYLTTAPIVTANWRATSDNVWTVPFGGGVGRIMKLGFQPVNISASFYGNAVYPAGTSTWTMRLQLAFLFSKLT